MSSQYIYIKRTYFGLGSIIYIINKGGIMKKIIRITMPDGSIWDVPADIIASNRAALLARANSDGDESLYREIFREEFDSMYSDDAELVGWAQNMSWGDVEHAADRIDVGNMDYDAGWKNGIMTVIDKDEIENNLELEKMESVR